MVLDGVRGARRFAGLAATAAATLVMTAAVPASAGTMHSQDRDAQGSETCNRLGSMGTACFHPNGDLVEVSDDASDGMRVSAQWRTSYGRTGTCVIPMGKDYRVCNYNMAEDREIEFRVHAKAVNGNQLSVTEWVRARI